MSMKLSLTRRLEALQTLHSHGVDNYHTESRSARNELMLLRGADRKSQQASKSKPAEPQGSVGWEFHDTQTGMLLGIPGSARCVQRFDDSLNSAIRITYRISLRSSSIREPRDPLLKVVFTFIWKLIHKAIHSFISNSVYKNIDRE